MKKKVQKDWRPRFKAGLADLRRSGNFLAVICQNQEEADNCEKAIVRSLTKTRK